MSEGSSPAPRIALAIVVAALVGFSIFGRLVYRAVEVGPADPVEALVRFQAARARFVNQTPMLEVDASGQVVPARPPGAGSAPKELKRLEVLAYHVAGARLVAAHVPFWFFSLKRPAAQLAVRGTGLDLDALNLSAESLSQHGPGLIIERAFPNGDRLLVWAE